MKISATVNQPPFAARFFQSNEDRQWFGFVSNSTMFWGTTALPSLPRNLYITVQTPSPGGVTSNSLQFEVDSVGSGTTPPYISVVTNTVTPGSAATNTVSLASAAANEVAQS